MTAQQSEACVLVVGASGFIGTRLVARLIARGERVRAVDIQPPRTRVDGVSYHQLDVRETLPVPLGEGVSRIYNLAAVHRTPGHSVYEYYETNVLSAANVTRLAESAAIGTIIFTSSISVYGPSEDLLTEQALLKPNSAYGHSKRLSEIIHETWLRRRVGRRLITVRPGVVFGPGERGNYSYLAHALARGIFIYPGRKTTIKSGGYVDELLSTMDFALSQSDDYILYNFAYPEQNTTEEIVAAFSRVCGFKKQHATLPVAPLYAAASLFEFADRLGIRNPIHRERILKLVRSTRVSPGWLLARDYRFCGGLEQALAAWKEETNGTFQ